MAVEHRQRRKSPILNLLAPTSRVPAGLLEQLLSLRSLLVQGQLNSKHAPAFITAFLSVWERAYIDSNLHSFSHRSHWLCLAAPLLLELLGSFYLHSTVQHYISNILPSSTFSIMSACRASFSCIPVRNGCPVSDNTVQEIQQWLLQHPKDFGGLVTPLTSTGVRWFLWAAAAALAEGAFNTDLDGLPLSEGGVQADHESLSRLPYREMMSRRAGTGAKTFEVFYGEVLRCLFHLYLVFPAEHGLSRLIGAGSEGAHDDNKRQHRRHGRDSIASCSSSRSSSSDSSRSWTTCSSSGGEAEGLDEAEGTGSSSHGDAGVGLQEEASGHTREHCSGSHAMEELSAAAAAAAAYTPSRKGHAPPASPADIRWLFLSLPYPSFSSSLGTATGGGAEAAVLAAAAPATGIAAEGAVPPVPAAAGGSGEPMPGIPGWYPAPPTLQQLLLVLELALLTWRPAGKGGGCNEEAWRCVLLLVGLLQQSSVEVRQQLMEQRGSVLLQLLYHVLKEDEGLGGEGMFDSTFGPFGVVSEATAHDVVQKISDLEQKGGKDCSKEGVAGIIAANQCQPSVHFMVLMALQSLMYELLPLESDGMLVEQLGGMITLYGGELRILVGARLARLGITTS